MRSQPKLRAVPDTPSTIVDIYQAWKIDIASRDWGGVHVSADRRQPIEIADAPKRGWLR